MSAIACFSQPEQLYFKHLTTEDGLSQGVVNNILTDRKGFTWFTSYDGINRFDGTTCISNNQIGPGMEGISVTRGIVEDKNGDIWIGSEEALIKYSYQTNRFEKFTINANDIGRIKKKPSNYFPKAAHKNNLLLNCGDGILLVFNTKTHQTNRIYFPGNLQGESLKEFSAGSEVDGFENNLLFANAYKDGYIFSRITGNQTGQYWWQVNYLKSSQFNYRGVMCAANDSTLYLDGNDGNVWQYLFPANSLIKLFHLKLTGSISTLYVDKAKRLWICTDKDGLYVYNPFKKKTIQNYRQDKSIFSSSNDNPNTAISISDDNTLWVSNWGRGVEYCRLADKGFSHQFTSEEANSNQSNNFIRGIVEGRDSSFYCNTQFGGIVKLDKNLTFKKTISTVTSNALGIDGSKSNLFFGEGNLLKYNIVSQNVTTISQSGSSLGKYPGSRSYYNFSPLKSGNILVASLKGVWCLDTKRNTLIDLPGMNDEGVNQSVFAYEDRNGNIYKYSQTHGLQLYQFNNALYKVVYTFPEKFTAKYLYEANDSTAWIASTNGLYLFNPHQLKIERHFTIDDGLPNNVIYAIAPDTMGRLWLSTNRGISLYTIATGRFKNFHGISGMQGNEYNSHTVVTASDGRIIFGGVNGLTVIRPWEVKAESARPKIQITSIKADSTINPFQFEEGESDVLNLQPGSSTMEFNFVAIEYNNPEACLLKYRLGGYDDDWVISKNPGDARYVHVKPGNYTFEIMAANADGVWGNEVKKLKVKVNAAWWQQGWFKFISISLIVVGILLFIRNYINQRLFKQKIVLEKQQAILQERERIIADLHDYLYSQVPTSEYNYNYKR